LASLAATPPRPVVSAKLIGTSGALPGVLGAALMYSLSCSLFLIFLGSIVDFVIWVSGILFRSTAPLDYSGIS